MKRAAIAAAAAIVALPLLIVMLVLGTSAGAGTGSTAAAAGVTAGPVPAGAPTAARFAAEAESKVGDPYIFGAKGPNEFDCSGLVIWSAQEAGDSSFTAQSSETQWAATIHISQSQLQPGDLIFEQWPGDHQAPPGHVVIYAGDGKVVEAPQPGEKVWIRSWSPSETQIIGYGQIPGLRY